MVEHAADDYARILQTANLEKEINPICLNIDDMLARLDEFETQVSCVQAETNGILENHVDGILGFSENFQVLRERIDNLEKFVNVVNTNVTQIERAVDIAEEELNVTDYSIRGFLLKPLLAKAKGASVDAGGDNARTNLLNDEFQAVPIFKSDEFFGGDDEKEKNVT